MLAITLFMWARTLLEYTSICAQHKTAFGFSSPLMRVIFFIYIHYVFCVIKITEGSDIIISIMLSKTIYK